MNEIIHKIAICVEKGKSTRQSLHPPDMRDQPGSDELTSEALAAGVTAGDILHHGLIKGMRIVGDKFRRNEIYLPDVLMSAKAMSAAMTHLKPHFVTGDVNYRGKIVLGTVAGDLHDIGKKIVGMFFEGNGWEVIDCGIDVSAEQFLQAIRAHQPKAVGLSALLTTTMVQMKLITKKIKEEFQDMVVIVGGAPVTQEFADRAGADLYSPNPQGALERLDALIRVPDSF